MKRVLFLIPCLLLSACVYNQNTKEQHTGVSITSQQIDQIEVGTTTKQWVLTNFGIPDRSWLEKDGLEVFEYSNLRKQKSNKTFIFLFNIESEKELSHKVTRVIMRDGLVSSINTKET